MIKIWTPAIPNHSPNAPHRHTCPQCGGSTIHKAADGRCLRCSTEPPARPPNLRNLPTHVLGQPHPKMHACPACGCYTSWEAESSPGLCRRCDLSPPRAAESLANLPGDQKYPRHPCPVCGVSTIRAVDSGPTAGLCLRCSQKDPLHPGAGPIVPEQKTDMFARVDALFARVNRILCPESDDGGSSDSAATDGGESAT